MPRGPRRRIMPANMTEAFHVVDGSCGADVLLEASQAARAGREGFLCLGRPPDEAPWRDLVGECEIFATAPHSAISARYIRGRSRIPRGNAVALCWSVESAARLAATGLAHDGRMAVRLASTPSAQEAAELVRLAYSCRLAIACRSERIAGELRGLDIPAIIKVIPPLGAKRPRGANRAQLRKRAGIEPGRTAVLAPGWAHRHSGYKYAIWAAGILTVAELPLSIVFEGGHSSRSDVLRFADEAGFPNQTLVAPAGMGLGELVAMADAAVFLCTAGSPAAALATAMSAGLPIAAADTPSITDWLTDDENALLAPPDAPRAIARAIMRIIEDKPLAERLGSAAKVAAAESFDAKKIRRRWRTLYKQLHAAEAR